MSRIVKYGSAIAAVAAGLLASASAFADTFSFSLPTSTVSDLTANAGGVITSVWVLVAIAIGIPLAFYILRKVIGLLPKR